MTPARTRLVPLVFLLALAGPAGAATLTEASPLALGPLQLDLDPAFTARVDGEPATGPVFGAFVMPGRILDIAARDLPAGADIRLDPHGHGIARDAGPASWRWRTPYQPGHYRVDLRNAATGAVLRLNVFVKQPFDHTTPRLNGYRIGHYEPEPLHGNPVYDRPQGLVTVTRANRTSRIAPDFTLAQFLCHQQPERWPKYELVRPRLLRKLEAVLTALRDGGLSLDTLTVMSGFRTPWYNADIGNTTTYSRHLYGGAADIYVDADHDDEMDDLNGDGAHDAADARWLADLIERVVAGHPDLAGGLSAYSATAYHGPFVHMDVRGTPVRW